MFRFVQLHILTNYPPSNLNRDDTGRPKSALMGDAPRLRISSQSQKRAWRTSDLFKEALNGNIGTRTKRLGRDLFEQLKAGKVGEKAAWEWARSIAGQFGTLETDKKKDLDIKQLVHLCPEELAAVDMLIQTCIHRQEGPSDEELALLRKPEKAVDIALFGRMLAGREPFNVEAAVQVSHAFTVHKSVAEDDYFSAIDDLNEHETGAAHIDQRGFGAGLFYLYVCINRELLQENLGNDGELSKKTLAALLHAVTKVSPTGMQNSHASRAHASFVLAEKGDQQPRSLAQAFLKPVSTSEGGDMLEKAVGALERRFENFNKVYGACSDQRCHFNVETGEGSLAELVSFVQE